MGTISLCMIVRNEAGCIETALKSAVGVDEIVICDTGSTDNTVEICKRYTDKVYTDYKWADNFAEARNHAASKCSMDYILILDADEVLQEGVMDELRKFDGEALAFRTVCANTGIEHQSIRLYKRNAGIKWYGAVHNYLNVEPSHVTGIKVIYHYSKSHELDPNRTLRILRKEVNKHKGLREMYYLGVEYINKNMLDKAIYWLKRYVNKSKNIPEKVDALVLLAKLIYPTNRELARRYCLEAIYYNPDHKDALMTMSRMSKPINRLKWQRYADAAENTNVLFLRGENRIRVTMLSYEDFGGSGYRIVEAVRKANPLIDIEQIVVEYPYFGHNSGASVQDIGSETVQHRINTSDIIHFKGDWCYNGDWHGYKLPAEARRIYTVGGSFFRREGNPAVCMPVADVSDYIADYKSALTPELIYSPDWEWTPHPYDGEIKNIWRQGEKINVIHVASDRTKKGSDIIDEAMRIVQKKRGDVEYHSISNVEATQASEIIKTATLYIDQILTGSYGNAAIEAMANGIPTAGHITAKYSIDCPVIRIGQTAESISNAIINVLDWDMLKKISCASVEYVQKIHSNVGVFWTNKYKELCKKNL